MCMYYVICILPMHFWPTVGCELLDEYWIQCQHYVLGYLYSKNVTGPLSSCCCRQEYQLFFYIPDTMDKWSYHVQCTEIAICSPNCVQIWKGSDRKMVFSGWVIKNVELTVRLFYVKACKKLFSDRNLCIWAGTMEWLYLRLGTPFFSL